MRTGRKVALTLISCLLFLTAGGYVAGRLFFKYHFFPGTSINGLDCSYMTREDAEKLIDREIKSYALAVDTMYHGREAVTAKEIDMSYDPDGTVEKLLVNQDIAAWFTHLSDKKTFTAEKKTSISDALLSWTVDSLDCMQEVNTTYPSDAHIVIEDDDTFTVVPEVTGNALDRDKARAVIRDAVLARKDEVNLEAEGCYLVPSVTADSPAITESLQRLENYKNVLITYDFGDRTEKLSWPDIKEWLQTEEDGSIHLDEEKVRAYITALGEKYNTVGNARTFVTYDDRTIEIKDSDYGWILDTDQETGELIKAIEAGTVDVRVPVYSQSAGSRSSANDIGMTYLEIDLMNQRMVCYDDGKPVVDTRIISGTPHNADMITPTGLFYLAEKNQNAGVFEDGMERQVNYLIKCSNGLSICDAPWRTEFGGEVYFWEGTDGSVLAPTDEMAAIFMNAEEGIPVIIYDEGRIW